MQKIRRIGKWRQLNLTLKTAYTKLWMKVGRLGEPFGLEMHSVTVGAFNRHGTQRMPTGRFLVWTTSWWDSHQGLMIINGILDLNDFSLLDHLLMLLNMNPMLFNFLIMINMPLMLHFIHLCLVLQSFLILINLPLMLHFSHMCLVL